MTRRRDQGSGTVLVAAAVAALMSLTMGVVFVLGAVVASHRAQAAADLAALAVGTRLVSGASPATACAVGHATARRNRATLTSCSTFDGPGVEVVVQVGAPFHLGTASARARAGPATAG